MLARLVLLGRQAIGWRRARQRGCRLDGQDLSAMDIGIGFVPAHYPAEIERVGQRGQGRDQASCSGQYSC